MTVQPGHAASCPDTVLAESRLAQFSGLLALAIGLVVARRSTAHRVRYAAVNAVDVGAEVVGYHVTGVQHVPAVPRRAITTARRLQHSGVERERILACPIISTECITDPRACF